MGWVDRRGRLTDACQREQDWAVLRWSYVAGLVSCALFAGAASAATSGTVVLKAQLTGKYLHTTSPGSGTATVTITATKVCWRFSYRGIDTPDDSGIHIAPPPAAGKHKTSVFPFTASTSTKPGCVAVNKWGPSSAGWATKIAAEPSRFYVIIATTKYPQGAIGGRLGRG
jgi:CHRD domain